MINRLRALWKNLFHRDQLNHDLDEELRAYVAVHPELRKALYKFPHRHGLAGTAAQFAWHVSDLMNKDRAYNRRARLATAKTQVA